VGELAAPRRSAILLATNEDGRVLLVRQRGGPFKDVWLLPGGGVKPDETFEDALVREVREETCLEVGDVRELARYDVRGTGAARFHLRVHMYAGRVRGEPRPGIDDEPVGWMRVDPAEAHPVLVRQLVDAGILALESHAIEARCLSAGIAMTRVAPEETSG
jgi:8-oxo-dGTP diphosphatase